MNEKIVLVLLDGSSRAEEALPSALLRARERGADLRLLQVVSPPLPFWSDMRERERSAWLYLDTVRGSLRGQGVRVECRVRRGSPIPTLLREAANAQAVLLSTWNGAVLSMLAANSLVARLVACPPCRVERVRATRDTLASKRQRVRSFEEDRRGRGVLAQRPVGLRSVPVHQIVGSVGRAHELNGQFLPYYAQHGDQRYRGICRAMARGEILPPVELYKLGDRYYALDGNHRVAAARALAVAQIDADVTEFVPAEEADAAQVFIERRRFEEATGCTSILAAGRGHYPRLQELMHAYAEQERISDLRDAGAAWYARIYLPVSRELEAAEIGSVFVGERMGDIVVHLADLRAAQEEFLGRAVTWEEAADTMLAHFRACQKSHRRRAGGFGRATGTT